ncbi:hypothetical protein O7623_19775 [Solwaraspora sp. WMMD791]|uniref:hypothetical protein n=1 Tax=Solwaraspora sp. WMMD791 TaxID=3016086 RepID=UPI00249BA15C|nr:hypothetical protein [Solwaraspora sp. WMMD791]WFE25612.1 hypothetical protein O7623_19775 [Solwaraspora sp. WMMD791]
MCGQIRDFVRVSSGATAKLSREQTGRFDDPKPSYVADWDALPRWQQETDADIFEYVAASWLAERRR